jgi:hypothetical protein
VSEGHAVTEEFVRGLQLPGLFFNSAACSFHAIVLFDHPPPRRDKAGARYVLKRALVESSTVKKRVRDMHADAEAAAISHRLAHAFNNAAGAAAGNVSYLTGRTGSQAC